MDFDVTARTILLVQHGSHAYGTNVATSDLDLKGICIPPKEYFLGYTKRFEQEEAMANKGHPHDKVVYNIQKFFKLAQECNPNIIEVLNVDEVDVVQMDKYGEELRALAPDFLSKKARHTFSGYAIAQLKRIKTHRRWLLDPPKAVPTREQFGLKAGAKLSQSEVGAYDALLEQGVAVSENALLELNREKAYLNAVRELDQYNDWKRSRNPARAELEAKYGYDTKHGAHLVRLMRMCREILEGKGVIVKRPDRDELLSIRAGAWSYDQIIDFAEKADAECGELYQTSTIQHSPDVKKLDAACISIVERYLIDA